MSIVGAGAVGTTLALLMKRKGYRIVSVISRRRSSAKRAAALVGCTRYSHRLSDLHPKTDFLLIATSDESIALVAKEISTLPLQFSALFAAHTSGFLTSDMLRRLRQRGATVFSLHPIQTFPGHVSAAQQVRSLNGISYGVEGSPRAVAFARRLVRRLGGRTLQVPKEQKISYHLACVFASNYSVALLGAVEELSAGFIATPRLKHFRALLESSIDNAFLLSPRKALTGPIARGSVKTVRAHIRRLQTKHRRFVPLYKTFGLYTIELARWDKKISSGTAKILKKLVR